ncbi:uncharacterized protein LOC104680065 [Rhinopithecus roxellana]|uniref:uncharacterized protein LOC104680065 n=1 Tax=Rhinopithecus roxellana TaxID=61622 RepID=UPI00123748A5|nr:uncharacterized protein LOC104680065 [Rhinopithecus roxellana]
MDDKTTRICHLLAKRKLPPPTPSSMPGHFWGQSDVAGVGMPKMELGRMTQSGRRGPVLQVSALAGVEPHNFASFAVCLSLLWRHLGPSYQGASKVLRTKCWRQERTRGPEEFTSAAKH